MITEDYVSFETAKLLKEKGFNEECFQYWHEEDNELVHSLSMHPIQNISNPCFFGPAAPTLQMAMKWLREKQIFITIGFCDYPILHKSEWIPEVYTHDSIFDEPSIAYSTYEEACEAAIKYCLENLI